MLEAGAARIQGASRTVGIIGWPVDHSLSPAIHNAAFSTLGLDWVYVPLPVEPGRLPEAMDGLGALGFAGANVTMPYKAEAADQCDALTEEAKRLHAVNTLVVSADGLRGHNTDAPGFDRFLTSDAGFDPSGARALIFGAGGAARACALALARGHVGSITVAVRDGARAAELRSMLDDLGLELHVAAFEKAASVVADLVVNATPLGGGGEELPLPELRPGMLVVDLLYHPSITPLQAAAREAGAATFGGLGLLLHQAAISFELWTGQPAPLEVMSAAALAALTDQPSTHRS